MTRRDLRPRRRLEPRERRAAILAAAEQVFGEYGYGKATVAAVAAAAQASEPLLYRYFAGGKDQMYAEVIRRALDDLRQSRIAAVAALPVNASTRDRIRGALTAHLDHVARSPAARTQPLRHPGNEPPEVTAIVANARQEFLRQLREWLPQHTSRHAFAVDGFLGFVDSASESWVTRGCPARELESLLEASLGALQGALGDWGS